MAGRRQNDYLSYLAENYPLTLGITNQNYKDMHHSYINKGFKAILATGFAIIMLFASCADRRSALDKGLADMDRGDYRAAIELFTASIEKERDLHSAYNNRGLSHLYLGNVEQAVEDFNNALDLGAEAVIFYNRALAYIELGRQEEAVSDLENAGRLNGTDVELFIGTANAMMEMGLSVEAENIFTKALALDPASIDAYNGRGNARMLAGDEEGAEDDWNRAVEIATGR